MEVKKNERKEARLGVPHKSTYVATGPKFSICIMASCASAFRQASAVVTVTGGLFVQEVMVGRRKIHVERTCSAALSPPDFNATSQRR